MSVHRGVVRGGVVILPDGVQLPEGSTVEIRVPSPAVEERDNQSDEEALMRLLEAGLISDIRRAPRVAPADERTPMEVPGKPLSEIIIEERR